MGLWLLDQTLTEKQTAQRKVMATVELGQMAFSQVKQIFKASEAWGGPAHLGAWLWTPLSGPAPCREPMKMGEWEQERAVAALPPSPRHWTSYWADGSHPPSPYATRSLQVYKAGGETQS